MFHDTTFPPPDGRLAGLMRELNALAPDDIGAAIDAMIANLDARDGDPDLEPTGDERDASFPEGWPAMGRLNPVALNSEDAEDDDDDSEHDGAELTSRNGSQHWDAPTTGTDDDEECSDRCEAGDDMMLAGPALDRGRWLDGDKARCWIDLRPGNEEDAEADRPPCYQLDQRAPLFVNASNDW